jgi:hypothetical protein
MPNSLCTREVVHTQAGSHQTENGFRLPVVFKLVTLLFPNISLPLRYAEEGASYIINPVEQTAHPAGLFGFFGVIAGGPPLTGSVSCLKKARAAK